MKDGSAVILGIAAAVTVAAAVRSTWSPCGWSMLSTITPMGERGRGRRFSTTAAWFVAGGVAGGTMLGGVLALLAGAVRLVDPSPAAVTTAAAAALAVGAASDARLAGFSLPIHRRQVNEDWLDLYRPWVYGAGFGWQIGTGFATYITTAALYAMVVLASLTADPVAAAALGAGFGALRGVAVLLGRSLETPDQLRAFHRRFEDAGRWSRATAISVQLAGVLVAVGSRWPWEAIAAAPVVVGVVVLAGTRTGRAVPSRAARV